MPERHTGGRLQVDSHDVNVLNGSRFGDIIVSLSLAINSLAFCFIGLSLLILAVFWIKFPSEFYGIIHDAVTTVAGLVKLGVWILFVCLVSTIGGVF